MSKGALLAMCGMAFLAAGMSWIGHRDSEVVAKQKSEVSERMPELFAKLVHKTDSVGMEPALVWKGATSRLLLVNQVTEVKPIGSDVVRWNVLARTEGGRFFHVEYELRPKGTCFDSGLECVRLARLVGLTPEQVRTSLFHQRKAELYRELFKEEMPKTEVDA